MTSAVSEHPEAKAELRVATGWLDSAASRERFLAAVTHAQAQIVAYAHDSRRPGYWQDRIGN